MSSLLAHNVQVRVLVVEDHVALANRIGEGLRDAGFAVDVVYGRTLAGDETTRNAASGGMLAFFEHPDQWRRLLGDQALAASAEEIVRLVCPREPVPPHRDPWWRVGRAEDR